MERKNQVSDEDSQRAGNSDWVLLIVLVALIVFVTIAVFLIIFETNGLYYPGWEPGKVHPFLNHL